MNEIQVFNHEMFGLVRTIMNDGEPLFCATDVARALGYSNPHKAISDHCHGVTKREVADNLGRLQETNFIPEGDVYRLIIRSQLPEAQRFEFWLMEEVLPDIRRHGMYATEITIDKLLGDPDTFIRLLSEYKEEKRKRLTLEADNSRLVVENTIMQPKAEYFDELVDRAVNASLRDTSKLLEVPERRFIDFLMKRKYLYRDAKGKLVPYAQYVDDLFVVKECFNDKSSWAGTQTLVTPKGRETFRILTVGMNKEEKP